MEVSGKIKQIYDTQTVGNKDFKKRELIVETVEQYPQSLKIEFVQDKCDLLNNYQVGQEVRVGINLRGREWVNPQNETVYFNTIQGWRIDPLLNAVAPNNNAANTNAQPANAQPALSNSAEPDDLPF